MSDVEMMQTNVEEDFVLPEPKNVLEGSEDGELTDSDTDDAQLTRHTAEGNKAFGSNGKDTSKYSIFDIDDLAKMEDRARRFGLDKASDEVTLEREMKELHSSLGVISDEDIRHTRFDTLHIRGTDKMNTNDIFEYFFSHKPTFLEWINDNSCNVVWNDDISAARAMVFYSKVIKLKNDASDLNNDIVMEEVADDVILESNISVSIPPGKWRGGVPHPKADFIFMRFANKSDKKASGTEKLKVYSKKYNDAQEHDKVFTGIISESMKSKIKAVERSIPELEDEKYKNPWGELCETWGINDSQEVFGVDTKLITTDRLPPIVPKKRSIRERIGLPIDPRFTINEGITTREIRERGRSDINLRLGKRPVLKNFEVVLDSESEEVLSSDEDWTSKSKVPRMRMHADDEQEKVKNNKTKLTALQWDEEINNITVEVNNENTKELEEVYERSRINKSFPPKQQMKTTRDARGDLRSRLGMRKNSYESDSDNDSSSDKVRGRVSVINKVQIPRHKPTVASTIWSRLDVSRNKPHHNSCSDTDSESDNVTDLRYTIPKTSPKTLQSDRPGFQKSDLRSRLGKKSEHQRSPLRIEVDNDFCIKSDNE